jgi:hypothetical protein
VTLTPAQLAALDHVRLHARGRKNRALEEIDSVLIMSNVARSLFAQAMGQLKKNARVGLHFHPDRAGPDGKTVAQSLAESGMYKSQFETFISNGSVSAHAGGARDLWEQRLFGGAYDFENSTAAHRPKYGALDLLGHADGPSPRFGSCYFLLKPAIKQRCSFSYMDSHNDTAEKGTIDEFDDVMAALLVEVYTRNYALGENDLSVLNLIRRITEGASFSDPEKGPACRNLNHYIEAQIHGEILLKDDTEKLIADPAFKGTETGKYLESISKIFDVELHWHQGFSMLADKVPDDFKGPTMPSLAKRLAGPDGRIDASRIGLGALSLKSNPESWHDRGDVKEVLQEFKLLWHVLVKYGEPYKG